MIHEKADIFTLIGNSREGAAAKKRRQLERKLNSMKTDMEKLNMKLLEAKDEVKSREARCYELQTLVTMRENKIKVSSVHMKHKLWIIMIVTYDRIIILF